MPEKQTIKPTPTADKMLSIISSRLNLRRSRLEPTTTWGQLGISPDRKEEVVAELRERFFIAEPASLGAIKTIWDTLKWIESAECYNRAGYYGR